MSRTSIWLLVLGVIMTVTFLCAVVVDTHAWVRILDGVALIVCGFGFAANTRS